MQHNEMSNSAFPPNQSASRDRMYHPKSTLESDDCFDNDHPILSFIDSGLGQDVVSLPESRVTSGFSHLSTIRSAGGVSKDEELECDFQRLAVTSSGSCEISSTTTLAQAKPVVPPCSDLFAQDEDGDTQLHLAIIQLNVACALWIIQMAEIVDYFNIQNNKYWHTPLHLAVITNQPNIVRALVVSGASLMIRDHQGNTALHLACSRGLLACLQQLTMPLTNEEKEYILQTNSSCNLPIDGSLQQCVQSHDMSIKNYEGETCLHMALLSAPVFKIEIINHLLVACGADINMQEGKCGYTVLHQAVKSRNFQVISFLLRQPGVNVNTCCYNGSTALTIAKSLNLKEVSQQLIEYGAKDSAWPDGKCDTSSDSEDDQMDDFDDLTVVGQSVNML